jgi:ABC-2 type transport system ATP-binding protein
MNPEACVAFRGVSKFYGETLGIDRVELEIPPGVTSLVGPNGSGKTTLLNLLTGLVRPSRGTVRVLGIPTDAPERLFRVLGYCSHFDVFPPGVTGRSFIEDWLRLHGFGRGEIERLAAEAIDRVGLGDAAHRRIQSYSKGMRQRIRLALALSHQPKVLVLDEPLNGLDPMARADAMALFQGLGGEGMHVIVSSHVLHEVERISDRVILLAQGYVVADGPLQDLRSEVTEHPRQMLVRCSEPHRLAARLFEDRLAVEIQLHEDGRGLLARTRDLDTFCRFVQRNVVADGLELESIAPVDDDAFALYRYLVEPEH